MPQFPDNLPSIPKKVRAKALVDHLAELLARSEEQSASDAVEAVFGLGRRWPKWAIDVAREPFVPLEVRRIIERAAQASYHRQIVITERRTGVVSGEVEDLMSDLEGFGDTRGVCHLEVVFDTPHAYVYGLCAIAAWAGQNACQIDFDFRHARVAHFLNRAGVSEALRNPASDPIQFDSETILGFTRIDPSAHFQTDTHAGRLVDLFRKHVELSDQTARALATSFAELIENAVKHRRIRCPAWLFANYHPQPKIMHICICDRGVGIQRSFLDSDNAEIRAMGQHRTDWIQ
jgi:hypothetical protein